MYLQLTHSFAKMHHTVRKVVFVCLLLGASAQRVEIPHKHFTTLAEGLADAERYMLQFNETFNFPSLAFGMAVRGKPVICKAWGRADLENSVAAKLSTKYRLGIQRGRQREGQINFCCCVFVEHCLIIFHPSN